MEVQRTRGHCIVFRRDLPNFVDQLPRNIEEMDMTILVEEQVSWKNELFLINPQKLLYCFN